MWGSGWLQLLRVPNLFTVPGDPLAGGLLAAVAVGASASPLPMVAGAGAAILLYAGGLLQNDYFDLAEDRADRPNRPLPAGRVNPKAAIVTAFALALAGVCLAGAVSLASGAAAATLLVVMTLYNIGLKRNRIAGPAMMGLCRGLSLLIGAAMLGWSAMLETPVLFSAAGLAVFVASITVIASRETQTVRIGTRRWLPAGFLAVWVGGLIVMLPEALWISAVMGTLAVCWALYCAVLLKGQPAPAVVQKTIGRFIGGLLLVQAAVVVHAVPTGLFVAAGLMLAWPVSRQLAKRFYAS